MTPILEATPNGTSPAPTNSAKSRTSQPKSAKTTWHIELLPIERIEASPYQPRLAFDPEEMADLVASVRVHGVQQPIIVRTCKADVKATDDAKANDQANGYKPKARTQAAYYQLIAGERRLRACKEAGRKHIPAILRDDLSDAQAAELALLENIQRSNLTVMEEAAGYKRLMLDFRMKEERIAKKVGKSVQTIRETIKLLQLPEPVQKLLAQKQLTAAHGRELLALSRFEKLCVLVANRVAREHLTALSLQSTPLPNATELKAQNLLIELDFRTKFDWRSTCAKCPHKAYVRSGQISYCLLPGEWRQKQQTAIEVQKQEAAQVLEAARQQGQSMVETERLTPGSYRDLSFATLPAGCSAQCHCRGESCEAHDPTRKRPVCLDPERFNSLVKAERQAHEEARRRKYLTLWSDAKNSLSESEELSSKTAALLTLPIVRGDFLRYGDQGAWRSLVQQVGLEVKVHLPWNELFESDAAQRSKSQAYTLLEDVPPHRLLLFAACLILAHEAQNVVRFGGETPQLCFVLGLTPSQQSELDTSDSTDEVTEGDDPDEEDFDEADSEPLDESFIKNLQERGSEPVLST
jgi:ParB family chromosome partitioning protein